MNGRASTPPRPPGRGEVVPQRRVRACNQKGDRHQGGKAKVTGAHCVWGGGCLGSRRRQGGKTDGQGKWGLGECLSLGGIPPPCHRPFFPSWSRRKRSLVFYIYLVLRERVRAQVGEGLRAKETRNPKQAPGSEPSAQSPTRGSNQQTRKIMT